MRGWKLSWPVPASEPGEKPEWRHRRLRLDLSLSWCLITASWIIFLGPDDVLRQTALVAVLGLGTSLLLGYFGFATQDDRNYLKFLAVTRARDPPPIPPQTGAFQPEPDDAQP